MARLTHEQIAAEIKALGYELVDDSGYTNMRSRIVIKCDQGHLIETCMLDIRHPSFICPSCDKNINFINPRGVPQKTQNTYRLIAFDQATENFGLSVFDDGELVFYGLYNFTGDLLARLIKIRKFVDEIVIKEWKPDFVVIEDIQYQHNVLTFKVLGMLLGILQELLGSQEIPFECVAPTVWRKIAGTNGKNRNEEKRLSAAKVKEKYNISVSNDIAEAILIGYYGARAHKKKVPLAFGSR